MPVVSVTIGTRQFQLACGEGQEGHVRSLADKITQRIRRLAEEANTSNEGLLLAMAAMMSEDELAEVKKSGVQIEHDQDETDAALADALNNISGYVEAIAERVESL